MNFSSTVRPDFFLSSENRLPVIECLLKMGYFKYVCHRGLAFLFLYVFLVVKYKTDMEKYVE